MCQAKTDEHQAQSKRTLTSLELDTGSEANMVPDTVVLTLQKKPQMIERKWLKSQADSWDFPCALEMQEWNVSNKEKQIEFVTASALC